MAVVTAVDADHLDIYGTHEAVKEAFAQFIERIRPGGALVLKAGVDVALHNDAVTVYRYAYDTATSTPATCSSSRAGTTATIWSRRRV